MRDFKKLQVWQKGFEIAVKTYQFSATLPKQELYGLVSQINRSGISIPSNVAEGSSRYSDKDKRRFAEISLGFSFELETQLLIAKAVSLGESNLCDALLKEVEVEQRMLSNYLKSLNPEK